MIDSREFNRLMNSTEKRYSNILKEIGLLVIASGHPSTAMLVKIGRALSKLRNTEIESFLLQSGNQDIKTATKIITNDLYGKNIELELTQALTLLKRGRDTFLSLIKERRKRSWNLFRDEDKDIRSIQDNYTRAFIATQFIAFCYKLLNDKTKADKAFNESKLYFYYRIYYYTDNPEKTPKGNKIKPLELSETYNMLRITDRERAKQVYAREVYNEIRKEEENFINISNNIFGKKLIMSLSNNHNLKTKESFKSAGKFTIPLCKVYTLWKPPITNW